MPIKVLQIGGEVRHFWSYLVEICTIENIKVIDQIPRFKIQKLKMVPEILDVEGVILN